MAELKESLNEDLNVSLKNHEIYNDYLTIKGEQIVQNHFFNLEHKLDVVQYRENIRIISAVILLAATVTSLEYSSEVSPFVIKLVTSGMLVSMLNIWFYHNLCVVPVVEALYELKTQYKYLFKSYDPYEVLNTGRQYDIDEN